MPSCSLEHNHAQTLWLRWRQHTVANLSTLHRCGFLAVTLMACKHARSLVGRLLVKQGETPPAFNVLPSLHFHAHRRSSSSSTWSNCTRYAPNSTSRLNYCSPCYRLFQAAAVVVLRGVRRAAVALHVQELPAESVVVSLLNSTHATASAAGSGHQTTSDDQILPPNITQAIPTLAT